MEPCDHESLICVGPQVTVIVTCVGEWSGWDRTPDGSTFAQLAEAMLPPGVELIIWPTGNPILP